MFNPLYEITDKLLFNIKKIGITVFELNIKRFPEIVLYELEKSAREISVNASTAIEGNPLPLTDVKQILKNAPAHLRDSEQEVINYNSALEYLNKVIAAGNLKFDIKFILCLHNIVMINLAGQHQAGKLRTEPVFVNNPKTGQTIYWPPDHEDVSALLDNLTDFVNKNRGKTDPLIIAGIFHKQFVIIHPFMDGNGRTARLLTKAILADVGLDTFNLFSFENYYNRNVTLYFNNVGIFGNYYDLAESVDYTGWLEYFTEGIIDELLRVKKILLESSVSPKTELADYHKKILELIEKKGFTSDRDYSKLTERAKATRSLDFKRLIDMGLIQRYGKGKSTYYKLKK
ncbi:MAG: Fic family protein [Actinobacteria bacterium]|nr:Fic family protein [Actinomycetota bacterium]